MKRYLPIIIMLLISFQLTAREVYNINRGWKFFTSAEPSSDRAETVNLPHTWNRDALGGIQNYYRGTGNYQKELTVPSRWSGKRIFIRSYGAGTVTDLFVNGRHVGRHPSGYTAFTFDVTDYLRFGRRNIIHISVSNAHSFEVLPTAGDATAYGGLFRDMDLIVTGSEVVALTDRSSDGVYILQRAVTDKKAEAEVIVKVNGVKDSEVQVRVTVRDEQREVVAQNTARIRLSGNTISTANIPLVVDNPRLWDGLHDPFMYEVTTYVENKGAVVDSVVVHSGFRYFSVDDENGFMLNGRVYPARGVVVHQDRALNGPAVTSWQVAEDVEFIREMGATMVRVAGVPHHPEFYRLCDRHGILVWNDFPLTGPKYLTDRAFLDTEGFRENGDMQAETIIRQLYNHPSVVMWGVFSDLRMRGDSPEGYVSHLNLLAKREDPSRLTVASSNQDGDINFITDLVVWNHFLGWREGLPSDIAIWRDQFASEWNSLRSAVSYEAGGSIFHQGDTLSRPDPLGSWHPERWQTHFHEEYFSILDGDATFWGLFAGNLFDYGAALVSWGGNNGINDCGLVTFDRKYRKDAFYLYKANWNHRDKFVWIAEKRWDRRRGRTQNIRVYSNFEAPVLFLNGEPLGAVEGTHGTFVWEKVELNEGRNIIEVRAGDHNDTAVIHIENSDSRFNIH